VPRADAKYLAAWAAMSALVLRTRAQLAERLMDERGAELGQYELLAALVSCGGRRRVHELADDLVLGRPTLSRLCDRAEHDDLVRRERQGRAVYVVLTRHGREEYRRCQPAYERFVYDAVARHLDAAELAGLVRALRGLPGVDDASLD